MAAAQSTALQATRSKGCNRCQASFCTRFFVESYLFRKRTQIMPATKAAAPDANAPICYQWFIGFARATGKAGHSPAASVKRHNPGGYFVRQGPLVLGFEAVLQSLQHLPPIHGNPTKSPDSRAGVGAHDSCCEYALRLLRNPRPARTRCRCAHSSRRLSGTRPRAFRRSWFCPAPKSSP